MQRCLSAPESSENAIQKAVRNDDALAHATPGSLTPAPLLREWAKAKLVNSSWKDGLASALSASILVLQKVLLPDLFLVRSSRSRDF